MREDDLCDLLKFDKKMLRAKLATLKIDKFIVVKLKIETGEDGKAIKMNCWFINYKYKKYKINSHQPTSLHKQLFIQFVIINIWITLDTVCLNTSIITQLLSDLNPIPFTKKPQNKL